MYGVRVNGNGELRGTVARREQLRLLAEAMAHPLRGRVLQAVAEKSRDGVCIHQLAARLRESKRRVRYHIDVMSELGLVEIARVRTRRGVTERFYRVTVRPCIHEELVDRDQARQLLVEGLKAILADASAAIAAKVFGMRPGHSIIRIAAEVDRQGWVELVAIQEAALAEAEAAAARAWDRLQTSAEPLIPAIAAMLLFEVPPWPAA
jgi:DNA-binding transcriptional ArsR family regulator